MSLINLNHFCYVGITENKLLVLDRRVGGEGLLKEGGNQNEICKMKIED